MDRFEYSGPNLLPNETYILRAYDIKLYDGESKTSFEKGEIILTSHRLLWSLPDDTNCLSLNLQYVIYFEAEKPSNFIFSKSNRLLLFLTDPSPNHGPSPAVTSAFNYIKLSFKNKIDSEFVNALTQAIEQKKWELPVKPESKPGIKLRTGIVGIERGLEEKHKAASNSISVAFQDLNKLMTKAKDMVNLSKNISAKLRDKQGDITDDETIKFKSYLLSLGIDDPVTRDSFQSEFEYFKKLALQISQIVEKPLLEVGGIMVLTDVYCRVNRARGLELLSPEDFLAGSKMMEKLNLPVILRQFDSGVKVLQSINHSDDIVVDDTYNLIAKSTFLTAEDLAKMLGIPVILAKERLITTEKFGKVCRDESIEGLRFYVNKFLENT